MAREYARFWFLIDLSATIPYDLIAMAFIGNKSGGIGTTILGFLKAPRLLRLFR